MLRKTIYSAAMAVLLILATAGLGLAQGTEDNTAEDNTTAENSTYQIGTAAKNDPKDLNATAMGTAQQDPWDLERAVTRGLEANPTIIAVKKELLGSEFGKRSAFAEFLPKFSVNYGYTYRSDKQYSGGMPIQDENNWALDLNLSQPLFTGFRLLSSYQQAALTQLQNMAKVDQAELALILNIQTNFLELLRARMDVKSSRDSVEQYKSQLKVNDAFYQVGLKPKVDVLRTEVELATEQQSLLRNQNTVKTKITRLNTLLDLPPTKQTNYVGKLAKLPFAETQDQCLNTAYEKRPDLLIGRKSVEIAQKSADIVASDFYPQVNADMDYYRNGDDPAVDGGEYMDNSNREYWTVGVSVNWKAFEWGKTYYGYKQSLETVAQMEASLADTRLNATYQVQSNILSLQNSADRINVGEKSVIAAKESYRMAVARYQAQVGTNTEVLDAQAGVTKSEAELNSALADYQTALAQLYYSMGIKNPSLKTY